MNLKNLLKSGSVDLPKIMFFSIFTLIVLATVPFAISNFKASKKKIVELSTTQLQGVIITYSEVLDGDSIEVDLKERRKNAYYDIWQIIADSTLKKNNVKYLYVMNINYSDSIEYYLSAEDHEGQIEFLEKEETKGFDMDMLSGVKSGSRETVCSINFTQKYGWLVSCYTPIKNSKGEVVAFAGADKEMTDMTVSLKQASVSLILANLIFVSVLCLMIIYVMKRIFINPIRKIIDAANNFNLLNKSFNNLDYTYIKEYNFLIKSFKKMEKKIAFALEKSFTDDLTKLNNRYFLSLSMENMLKPSGQEKKLAFFIIDIDHFKEINDTYGHEKGDFVLKCIGAVLRDLFSGIPGVVIRLGGDEFAICLENVEDSQFIESKCKEFKERIAKIKYSENAGEITASVGVAMCKFSMEVPSYSELFSAADSVLYKVKADGRNGYRIASLPQAQYTAQKI